MMNVKNLLSNYSIVEHLYHLPNYKQYYHRLASKNEKLSKFIVTQKQIIQIFNNRLLI
jgi:hypothetical protein